MKSGNVLARVFRVGTSFYLAKVLRGLFIAICCSLMLVGFMSEANAAPADLMHNSTNLGTKYGTWGTTDDCLTCHESNGATNIKKIKSTIKTKSVVASSNTGYGDDSDGRGAVESNRVCEVCHTQTDYHRITANSTPDLTHNNGSDCISCHQHNLGFKDNCGQCHGYPPGALVTGAKDTGSLTAGAHGVHVTTLGYACAQCHNGSVGSGITHDSDGTVTITFANLPTGTGGANGGSYSGQTGVTYDNTDGGTTSVPGANDGQMTCANYCHGSTVGGAGEDWNDPTAPCGSCHGATAGSPPANPASGTSHATHAGSGGQNRPCTDCHGAGAGASGHIDGDVAWSVGGLPNTGSAVTYRGSSTGSTGNLAPSATYGTCSNVNCHNDGLGNGVVTPAWDTAGDCTICHASDMTTGSHSQHLFFTGNASCGDCHDGATKDSSGGTAHLDGNVDVLNYATANAAYGSATWTTCSTLNCHGSVSPTWTSTNSNSRDCSACHGMVNPAVGRDTNGDTATSDIEVGFHVTHLNSAVYDIAQVDCDDCHLVPNGADYNAQVFDTGHIDSALPAELTWSALTTNSGGLTPGFNDTTGVCSNVYCHDPSATSVLNNANTGTVPAPDWNGAGWNNAGKDDATCDPCHQLPPPTSAYDHSSLTIASDCSGCHGHNGRADATHMDGNLDASGGACDSCHGGATPAAGVDVNSPHVYLTSADAVTGPSAAAACDACHPGGTRGAMHAKNADANVVLIANNTTVGINYVNGTNGYSGDNGIVLGGDNTTGTTEAEICWNCHNGASVTVDWRNGDDYNNSTAGYTVSSRNWTAASFQPPGARLPNRPVASIHSVNASALDSSVGNNVNGSGVITITSMETAGDIRCSYCHDVHDTYGPDWSASSPYLRGSWLSNPYPLERPPQSGDTYGGTSGTNQWNPGSPGTESQNTSLPRLISNSTASQMAGGFMIDQNSGFPTSGYLNATKANELTNTAGLCVLCHGSNVDTMNYYGSSLWRSGQTNGHSNASLGGSGSNAADLFDARRGQSNGLGYMGFQDGLAVSDFGTLGLKEGSNTGPFETQVRDGGKPGEGNNNPPPAGFGWYGGTIRGNAKDGDWSNWYAAGSIGDARTASNRAHDFSCSKCHSPHAAGLPALLITNCLDYQVSNWSSGNGNPTIPQAVNCHRNESQNTGWHGLAPNQ